jgi:sec-independent protein translocase protein TatA
MPSIGPLELAIVLVIVLLIFGPKRLPGLGKQLGTGMREFKDSITGKDKDEDATDAFGQKKTDAAQITAAPVVADPPPAPAVAAPAPAEPPAEDRPSPGA